MTTDRPKYLYPGGNVVMHSPLKLQDADMYGFFIKGDLTKLQRSVDGTLNTVAGARMNFKVLSPYVMLTFTRVGHASSTNPVDHAKGWITEIDIVTWIMVGRMEDIDGKQKLGAIYWYPFHIFVDDSMALINGRELFGYPKYECEYEIPPRGTEPDKFSLSVKGFQPFAPETELALHPLLEVAATDTGKAHRPVRDFLDLIEQAAAVLKTMPDFLDLDVAGWEEVLSLLRQPRTPQIFLKQFPDSAGEFAVYQAIVAAPAVVDTVHSGRLLDYRYQCTLHEVASFPLQKTLGLQIGAQPALLSFNMYFDFTVTPGEELINNSRAAPRKIAVLGGGVGAMTAAFYLTDQPGWQDRYDITVYQMGWRLGGKGASGRNAEYGERIEEHGLHIWFGFYENGFDLMRRAYGLLERPPGAPLRNWNDAFKPHNYIALTEHINGKWKIWPIDFPPKPGTPGDGSEQITLWQIAVTVYAWIKKWIGDLSQLRTTAAPVSLPGAHPDWLHRLAGAVKGDVDHLANDVVHVVDALHAFVETLPDELDQHGKEDHELLSDVLDGIRDHLQQQFAGQLDINDDLRRLFIAIDLAATVLRGMSQDGVFKHGFDVINDDDFRDWLRKHGANEKYSVNSAPVIGFYDLVFAYENGDFNKPNVEAGTLLRAMLRIALCYKGGIMWKMQAGMGDTIFTPIYQLLKKRGVKFKFFHRVEELVPDGDAVGEIRMTKQVAVTSGDEHYDPFVYVNNLACWPSTPNYGQILEPQAKLLKEKNVNLESLWSDWPQLYQSAFGEPLPQVTLKRGRDFDDVIFGISLASVPLLCPKLVARSAPLKTTTEKVKTVVTQAYQVWLDKDLHALGWNDWPPSGQEPVLSGFTEPFDTWAPMDQLLCREKWPAGNDPQNVSYFCSAMPTAGFPPPDDHGFPARCAQQVKDSAVNQLNNQIYPLWPEAGKPGAFQWGWLVDLNGGSGAARFDSQYWRANIDPSERYVMSVAGSTVYRLATDGAGFGNLYITGDWIKTGINAGCVEAAVMAGMQTSRAISSYPKTIKGETDF